MTVEEEERERERGDRQGKLQRKTEALEGGTTGKDKEEEEEEEKGKR